MKILVDMDDVLKRLAAGWMQYLNERYGTRTALDDLNDWDIAKAFPTLTHEQVYAALNDDALWDYVTPVPDAISSAARDLLQPHSTDLKGAQDAGERVALRKRLRFAFIHAAQVDAHVAGET